MEVPSPSCVVRTDEARSGHGHIVKELLARGGDPQALCGFGILCTELAPPNCCQIRTEDGSTLLHHAASGNTAEARRAQCRVQAGSTS